MNRMYGILYDTYKYQNFFKIPLNLKFQREVIKRKDFDDDPNIVQNTVLIIGNVDAESHLL